MHAKSVYSSSYLVAWHCNLQALIQFCACGYAGRDLVYLTFGDENLKTRIADVHEFLVKEKVSVGKELISLSWETVRLLFDSHLWFRYCDLAVYLNLFMTRLCVVWFYAGSLVQCLCHYGLQPPQMDLYDYVYRNFSSSPTSPPHSLANSPRPSEAHTSLSVRPKHPAEGEGSEYELWLRILCSIKTLYVL